MFAFDLPQEYELNQWSLGIVYKVPLHPALCLYNITQEMVSVDWVDTC